MDEQEAEVAAAEVVGPNASFPIDPFAIAESRGITVQPASLENFSGCLVRKGSTFGILYSDKLANDGFERFTVAHELGHYFLPGHPEALFRGGDGVHQSHSGLFAGDPIERQADHFAASLLMPAKLFAEAIRSERAEGFKAVEALAAKCRASITATARRFAEHSQDPVAVIMSQGQSIEWFCFSEPLRQVRGLTWPRKGSPLPRASATARFNRDAARVARGERDEAVSILSDWFDGPHDIELNEDVVGLGRYGRTLTVLFTNESLPDEDEDADD